MIIIRNEVSCEIISVKPVNAEHFKITMFLFLKLEENNNHYPLKQCES